MQHRFETDRRLADVLAAIRTPSETAAASDLQPVARAVALTIDWTEKELARLHQCEKAARTSSAVLQGTSADRNPGADRSKTPEPTEEETFLVQGRPRINCLQRELRLLRDLQAELNRQIAPSAETK